MESLNIRLRLLFNKRLLYTVDEIVKITGENKRIIQSHISRMKNPKYASKFMGTLDLVQDIGYYDGLKRWGLRGVKKIYKGQED